MLRSISYSSILHVLGVAVIVESIFMLAPIFVSLIYHEEILTAEFLAFLPTFSVGTILFLATKRKYQTQFTLRESFIIISHIWLIVSLFGSLPYITTKSIPHFSDAFFESVSGFTTTGSSILIDIEALPKGMLFWRALTHWLGGMGIIVLVVAVMRQLKIAGSHLMIAEGSLYGIEKFKPRVIDVAKQLWTIYISLTLMETILLKMAGMTVFDAVCHSFATIATGGFSTKNTSVFEMNIAIQYIIIIFMTLSGVNFSLYFFALTGKLKKFLKDEELRVYLSIIAVVTILITLNTLNNHKNIETAFRHSLFQTSSIITCTGFGSADYETWPTFSKMLILIIMLIGASIGSTGGGIKVARYIIIFKSAKQMFRRILSLNQVKITKFNNQKLGQNVINSVLAFASIYILTIIVGTFIMCTIGHDISTSASSIITTLGGIGPGFGNVGPTENFSAFSVFGKLYLSVNMLMGRLEIMSVLILFHPSFRKI